MSEQEESIYEGGFVVTCDGPNCDDTTLMEPGAPGPVGWIDLSSWDDSSRSSNAFEYFCSVACLDEAMPGLVERYGERFPRR